METLYLGCAIVGGTLYLAQFVVQLLGFGEHHDFSTDHLHGDIDHDGLSHWFVGVLSFRTIVSGLLFFGLAGMAGTSRGWDPLETLAVSVACGAAAFVLVASIIKTLHKLKSDGTVRIERCVGKTASVYLKIPGKKSGAGKVTVIVQNRTMEYQAVTAQEELPTGSQVVVVSVLGPETVEVSPIAPGGAG